MAGPPSLLHKINQLIAQDQPFFSFEFFPPKTPEGTLNLYDRIERMRVLGPAWVDITWGAGGSSSEKTIDICKALVQRGFDVMMHLTCTNVGKDKIVAALDEAKAIGVKSILALRGDPPMKEIFEQDSGFDHAVDLVRFIREKYGKTFTIAVAGYPEGHYSSKSFDEDIFHLKEKVVAGADLIITQLCYDVDMFKMFVRECKEAGITCPIVAGLMPIYSHERFERITHLTQVIVPEDLIRKLYPVKDKEELVKEVGIEFISSMVDRLLKEKISPGFHFYTLNLEKSVTKIIQNTKMLPCEVTPSKPTPATSSPLEPYIKSSKSDWDDFPNERWGDERSPAFGNLINEVWYSSLENAKVGEELLSISTSIRKEEDVFKIFVDFCEGKISSLPWVPDRLSAESSEILAELVNLNRTGFLTINSQPSVNGLPSSDKTHGWGDPNGAVFQKAYAEFFCSPENWKKLEKVLQQSKTVTYLAGQIKGDLISFPAQQRNVLTWGIFPGKEVIQTTLIGVESFEIWRKEAFSIWRKSWISRLDPTKAAEASKVLERMMNTYYLVNIVENDFVRGDLFSLFREANRT